MRLNLLPTAMVALAAGWLIAAPSVTLPAGFTPWTVSMDLSRWETANQLQGHWRIRRDRRHPAVAETALLEAGTLAFNLSGPSGAAMKVKAQLTHPRQTLTLILNGRPLAVAAPAAPGHTVQRWWFLIEPSQLTSGHNMLELRNNEPTSPLIIEKVEIGNTRKVYPKFGAALIPDIARPAPPSPTAPPVPFLLLGLVVPALAWWLTNSRDPVVAPSQQLRWWALALPTLLVLMLGGIAAANAAVPYAVAFQPHALWNAWLWAWGLGIIPWCCRATIISARLNEDRARQLRQQLRHHGQALIMWGVLAIRTVVWRACGTIGRVTRHPTLIAVALGAVVVTALFSRSLYYLDHASEPFILIGTGSDGEVYFRTAWHLAETHPYLLSLLSSNNGFPLLFGVWNSPVVVSVILSGFIKLWGIYPGLMLWGWSLAVLGGLFCLIPYLWQRASGYRGLGGLLVGGLWTTSQVFQREQFQTMTDLTGVFMLGLTYLAVARLVRRERWGDAVAAGVIFVALGYSRTANLYLGVLLLATLGVWWLWIPATAAQRTRRLALWGGTCAVAIAGVVALDQWILSRGHQQSFLWTLTTRQFAWGLHTSPATQLSDSLGYMGKNLMAVLIPLRQDHPIWLSSLPVVVGYGAWGAWHRRSPVALPCALVLVPWAGYVVMLAYGSPFSRYALPWLLLEGLLLAQVIDAAWSGVARRLADAPARRFGVLGALLALLILGPGTAALRDLWHQAHRSYAAMSHADRYLDWARGRLPDNAVILAGHQTDPWRMAHWLQRPMIHGGLSHRYLLWVDPSHLARHPYREATSVFAETLPAARAQWHETARLIEAMLGAGRSVWLLDPTVDPTSAPFFADAVSGRVVGFMPPDAFQLRTVTRPAADPGQSLYEIVATMRPPPARRIGR